MHKKTHFLHIHILDLRIAVLNSPNLIYLLLHARQLNGGSEAIAPNHKNTLCGIDGVCEVFQALTLSFLNQERYKHNQRTGKREQSIVPAKKQTQVEVLFPGMRHKSSLR